MHKKSLIDKKIPVIIRFTGILWNIKVSNSGVRGTVIEKLLEDHDIIQKKK